MSSKMVHIINRFELGGVEIGVLNLLKSHNKDYFVIAIKGADNEFINFLTKKERSNLILANGYISTLYHLIRIRPKLLITSLWRSHFIGSVYCLIKLNVKRYHFAHSSKYAHILDKLITKVSFLLANVVLCDSNNTLLWVKENINKTNIKNVPMYISFSKECKKNFNNQLSFVYTGRISDEKNLNYAVYFIHEIYKYNKKIKFDIYGRDDGSLESLSDLINKLNLKSIINYKGAVNPMFVEETIQGYDFYLQSSLREGMSISVFQAIKNKLIPIVNPVGEISEYTKDGFNAMYLDINDVKSSCQKFINEYNSNAFFLYDIGVFWGCNNINSFSNEFFKAVK